MPNNEIPAYANMLLHESPASMAAFRAGDAVEIVGDHSFCSGGPEVVAAVHGLIGFLGDGQAFHAVTGTMLTPPFSYSVRKRRSEPSIVFVITENEDDDFFSVTLVRDKHNVLGYGVIENLVGARAIAMFVSRSDAVEYLGRVRNEHGMSDAEFNFS